MTLRGSVVIHKEHLLTKGCFHFSMTPCLQELICFIGMQHTYNAASKIFYKLLGITITAKQIERVCTFYGKKLYESYCIKGLPAKKGQSKCSILYVLIDGSFVPIRNTSLQQKDMDFVKGKDSWKEVKLARLIENRHIVKTISKDRNYISHSDYLVHLGSSEPFLEQLRQSIENRRYEKIIFLGDGAKWIWNWISDTFSKTKAIEILDYYHAMEHINTYGKINFTDERLRKDWVDLQQERLMADDIMEIINELETEQISTATNPSQAKQKALGELLTYLKENCHRMYYKTYKKQGLEIGSGAIESAHRVIIQQRAKLSGQRWTMDGVQSILSLRAAYHSGRWDELLTFIKTI